MKYRRLGRTGLHVSEISLGTMAFGRWIDKEASFRVIDEALDAGINLLDTADLYGRGMDQGVESGLFGESESILGEALKGRRDQVIVATKAFHRVGTGINEAGANRYHLTRAIEQSLKRLQTDYIDLYQIHSFDNNTPLEETLSTLYHLVQQGKIRYIGCSNFAAWQIAKANGLAAQFGWEPFVSVQPEYSLVTRDIEKELIPYAEYDNIGIIVYSPLGRGTLTGKYRSDAAPPEHSRLAAGERKLNQLLTEKPAITLAERLQPIAGELGLSLVQLALAWVLRQQQLTSALLGVSKAEQISHSLPALEVKLTDEVLHQIDHISRETGVIIP